VKDSNKISVASATNSCIAVDGRVNILPWWSIFEPSSFIPLTCTETECKSLENGIFPARVSSFLNDCSAGSRKNLRDDDDKSQQLVIYSNPQQVPMGLLGCSVNLGVDTVNLGVDTVNLGVDTVWRRLFNQREEDNLL